MPVPSHLWVSATLGAPPSPPLPLVLDTRCGIATRKCQLCTWTNRDMFIHSRPRACKAVSCKRYTAILIPRGFMQRVWSHVTDPHFIPGHMRRHAYEALAHMSHTIPLFSATPSVIVHRGTDISLVIQLHAAITHIARKHQ